MTSTTSNVLYYTRTHIWLQADSYEYYSAPKNSKMKISQIFIYVYIILYVKSFKDV